MTSAKPRRLPSGKVVWRVQFRVNGKVTSESFRVQSEAEKFAKLVDRVGGEAAQKVRDSRDTPVRTTPTLREWTDTYLEPANGHLNAVTDATRAGYRQIAERSFLQILGEMPIDVISKQDVAKWIHWQEQQPSTRRRDQKVSAKTVANYQGLLSSMLAAATETTPPLIVGNPARKAKITKGRRQGVTFLTVDEVNRLVAAMPPHYRPLTLFLAWTGTRWGEATALTWGDIDTSGEEPTVRIDKAWKKGVGGRPVLGPPKSDKANRTIGVAREVIAALGPRGRADELVIKGIKSGDRLWYERYQKAAWQPALRALEASGEPLGKRPTPHALRHSHASWLVADGVPLPYVQARLGHEKITTTSDTYSHLMPDANQRMSAAMARRMSTASTFALDAPSAPAMITEG